MLGDRSRVLRLVLLAMTVFAAVTWPTKHYQAYAAGDDDDDSGGGDDDDSGGAKAGGGDDDGGGGDDDDADADADQPPVTAGGLYTKATYPISTIDRPLTLIEGMTEVQVGIGADLSAKTAFDSWNAFVNAHYGIKDNQEIQLGLATDLNNFKSLSAYAAYEGALSYDLVDFRVAFVLPVTKTTDATSGTSSTDVAPGVQFGFPVKYRLKPQVAIIALKSLMTINFKSKPDLTPSIGVIGQIAPPFAIVAQAGITIAKFDTDAGFSIPVSIAAQFTPSNTLDLGLQFSFPNVKPQPDPAPKFYDTRALALYANLRF